MSDSRDCRLSNYHTIYTDLLMKEIKATPDEYLPALLNMIRIFRESITLKPAVDSFKQGWQEALTGEKFTVDELWAEIEDE